MFNPKEHTKYVFYKDKSLDEWEKSPTTSERGQSMDIVNQSMDIVDQDSHFTEEATLFDIEQLGRDFRYSDFAAELTLTTDACGA